MPTGVLPDFKVLLVVDSFSAAALAGTAVEDRVLTGSVVEDVDLAGPVIILAFEDTVLGADTLAGSVVEEEDTVLGADTLEGEDEGLGAEGEDLASRGAEDEALIGVVVGEDADLAGSEVADVDASGVVDDLAADEDSEIPFSAATVVCAKRERTLMKLLPLTHQY